MSEHPRGAGGAVVEFKGRNHFVHEAILLGIVRSENAAGEGQLDGAALADGQRDRAMNDERPEAQPDLGEAEIDTCAASTT
ncbi:MAG: hypothetical protein QM757_14625 [Paludibaculum sp.]